MEGVNGVTYVVAVRLATDRGGGTGRQGASLVVVVLIVVMIMVVVLVIMIGRRSRSSHGGGQPSRSHGPRSDTIIRDISYLFGVQKTQACHTWSP